jgi:hypothetical protein
MQAITDWLNGARDYSSGVHLYLKHGRDPLLKKLFTAESKTAFKEKKLADALRGLLQRNQVATVDLSPQVQTVYTRHQGWPAVPISDAVLNALHAQWKPLYSEMQNLQARIYDVAEAADKYGDPTKKQEACEMAHRIADIDDQLDDIYFKRDFYVKENRLPAEPTTTPPVAAHMWPKKLANAQRYVREYKNKVEKNPANESAAAKLKYYQQQVDYYKKLMKLD